MVKWKLYWVASDGCEDCFVVAKNSRSARRIEKDMNGFEDDDLKVTKVIDIPDKYEKIANEKFHKWSIKNRCNQHLDIDSLNAWPYYAEDWLLKKLGAEFRFIDGEKQTLIDDVVYAPNKIYPIGLKAMKGLYELTGEKVLNISNVTYEGIEKAIENMLGYCLTLIHDIENDITNSFIFAIENEKYKNYSIEEVTKYWKNKLTFGRLIELMENRFDIDSCVRKSWELFLVQRNKIAHGLTKDERYDIETFWGQKELVGYLCTFINNAILLKEVSESAYIASMSLGYHLMQKENKNNKKFLKDLNDFHSDPYIKEKLSLFFDTFKLK